jgi:hypothetical protein
VPWELLRELVRPPAAEEAAAASALVERLGPASERDVWISSAALDAPRERILRLGALAGGWAVLREPATPLPAATLLWARPTLLAGDGGELGALLEAATAEAPRWRAASWLRRRLARIRAVVAAGGEREVEARLAALGLRVRVLPFPEGRW